MIKLIDTTKPTVPSSSYPTTVLGSAISASMTMELDCFLDYCLSCDRQTSGGAYCCQSCRLADIETSSCASEPVSPTSAAGTRTPYLQLEPAFDFAAHRSPSLSSPPSKYRSQPCQQNPYFPRQSISAPHTSPNRLLTPSTSQSSLDSTSSNSLPDCQLSAQARTELRGYTSAFNSIRNWREQVTSP